MTTKAKVPSGEHGLRSSYVNLGCRCALCKRANTEYMRPYMQDWKQGIKRGFPQKAHRKKEEET